MPESLVRGRDGLNRIMPGLPASAYVSFRILAPVATHFRPATCEEVDCPQFRDGWALRTEGLTEQDIHLATHCGRRYRQVSVSASETWLVFEAGQPCFRVSQHRLRVDRPERYLVTGGDWRGNPRGTPPVEHTRAADWQEHFAEHQDQLITAMERG